MCESSRNLLLILSSAVVITGCLSSHGRCASEKEIKALADIKSDMYDDGRRFSSWTGDDCCKWKGVTCDNTTGRHVISLDLSYINGINSTGVSKVNPSLLELKYLQKLNLSMNNFSGASIPEIIASLVYLEHLDLSDAVFAGSIPPQLGNLSYLSVLDLSNNKITGCIPQTLGNLSSLERLHLSNNSISGQIPSMAGLCNLSTLDLSYNNFTGEIADLLDSLPSSNNCPQGAELSTLNLQGNKLSGRVPSSLGQLSQLQELDLSSNSLQGNITESHFSRLAKLDYLDISHNNLYVILPDYWDPPFNASSIIMSFCHIGGKLPEWIRSQTFLQRLYLSGVGLSGNLPVWFSEFFLEELDLSSNHLDGPLPFIFPTYMDLSNNSFAGPINWSSVSLTVAVLSLSNNYFNGSIPLSFCDLTSLRVLDLSKNHLFGEVPNCHGSFPASLQSLHLSNNELSGSLPSFLAQCEDLKILDLGENKLSGEIPEWLGRNLSSLQVLRLTSNQFRGVIPISLAKLASLQVLDLSSNNLYGSIPSSVGNFSSMISRQNLIKRVRQDQFIMPSAFAVAFHDTVLYRQPHVSSTANNKFYTESILITAKGSAKEYTSVLLSLVISMDLSNNNLSGEIPNELTYLVDLDFLNLSNNHLTGRIPEKIDVMRQLESLDLSVNNLTGDIPSSICALSFLDHLNLSYNNLVGRIPAGSGCSQLDTQNQSSYAGNKDLCGIPLGDCPGDAAGHRGPFHAAGHEEDSAEQLEKVLLFASIALGFVVGFWCYMSVVIVKRSMRMTLFRLIDKGCDWIYVQWAAGLSRMNSK